MPDHHVVLGGLCQNNLDLSPYTDTHLSVALSRCDHQQKICKQQIGRIQQVMQVFDALSSFTKSWLLLKPFVKMLHESL